MSSPTISSCDIQRVTLDTSKLNHEERQKLIDDVTKQGWVIKHTLKPRINPDCPMHRFYYEVYVPKAIATVIAAKLSEKAAKTGK